MTDITLTQAISNLELTSNALEKAANSDANYNTEYGYYLAQMSATMYRNASELKEYAHMLGGF